MAVDGLSIIVNEKNPVEQLTMAQVGAMYRGEIKSWKAVGDFQKPVSLYGRQSNSGTYVFMQELVLGNKNYSTDMKEMNGNAQIIEGVLQDEGAVGYVGVGYLFDKTGHVRKGLKVVKISKEPGGTGLCAYGQGCGRLRRLPHRPAALHVHERQAQGRRRRVPAVGSSAPKGQAIVEREGFFTVGEGKYKAANDKNFK